MTMRRVILFGVKTLVAGLLIALLLSRVSMMELMETFSSSHLYLVVLAFLLMTFNFLAASLNLSWILASFSKKGRFPETLRVTYITQFFVFSGLGEFFGGLVKFRYLNHITRGETLSAAEKATVVVVEKAAGVIVTLWLTVLFLFLFRSELRPLITKVHLSNHAAYLLLGLLSLSLLFSRAARGLIVPHVHRFIALIAAVVKNHRCMVVLLLGNTFMYFNNILINYLVFDAVQVPALGFSTLMVLNGFIFLSQFLPISIGGLGVKENVIVYVMVLFHVSPEQSVPFSLICLFLTMCHSMFGGLLFLINRAAVSKG
jgi:uncharacterized membrane protein YbhN (UPF0104 family)